MTVFYGLRDADQPRPPRIRGGDVAAWLAAISAVAGIAWLAADIAVWALLDEGRLTAWGIQ